VSELPKHLLEAMERGELSDDQLHELIALEARALGLSFDQAVAAARAGSLPKNYIGTDLELLIDLLPVAA
jgi:hypothetical protein